MNINTDNHIPIKMWLDTIEEGALSQAENLANLPFAFRHIAIMPDVHQGYGMPIGGVLATQDVVIPNAVGVDIGCGMCAAKTSLKGLHQDKLKKLLDLIRQDIPTGFHKHKVVQYELLMPSIGGCHLPIVQREWFNARKSLGTLGGGNHFIEIQEDEEGFIWIMIHSGSRNLGKQVADVYNKVAVYLNERWYTQVPKQWDLAFLPLNTPEADRYLAEMDFCVRFAFANRKLMMDRVRSNLRMLGQIFLDEPILNIAHNYARLEHHFSRDVMVHRKGATSARKDEIGIIPGSQGTSSYIVRGLGNQDSFTSCSHGAGRKMGRKQACKTLSLIEQQAMMQGIIHSIRTEKDLDEAPGAYKDIDVVMENQKDLVEIVTKLTPIAVVKG